MLVYVWANPQAYAERSWLLFYSQTTTDWDYDPICFASNTGYSSMGASERSFGNSVMDLPTGDTSVTYTDFLSSSQNVRTEGYANVFFVSSTQIKIRLYTTASRSFAQVFRMGFRFYTPRLKTTSCSSVSVWTNRWGWNNFNGNAYSPGSFGVYCGNAGSNTRRFYAIFDMYYTTSATRNSDQWPSFGGSDTY